ncbi:hypothetical protein NQ314_006769 [Rhamnusium bicolor]|uniref:Uncharacterized protein n=1 Tax=Rhamnusium bicolor TaxID=1586634 RepID=A0AAV8YWH9_9CUCU|nr:hypothetical protein NQ314_006769 [Rhamnusium bicolor]
MQKFETYLKNLITRAKVRLVENSSHKSEYRNLLEGIFCTVMIFNKRRVGELQRMTVLGFLKNYNNIPSSEFERALTNSEKILYQSLKRIVIRGKRGRGVPVLFDKSTVESIEYLIAIRKNFDLAENTFLFGVPGTMNSISGYAVLRKHAKIALHDDQRALLITSTKLRKQLATITQIFKMEQNELEQLAKFMGHTGKTHAEYYRLPDDIYQTAKISKLLLLSKEGALEKFKGKKLEEIDIDVNVIEENGSDEEEEAYIPALNEALEDNSRDQRETEENCTENLKNMTTTSCTSRIKMKKILEAYLSSVDSGTKESCRNFL